MCHWLFLLRFTSFHFIFTYLGTIAPSVHENCFSGGRGNGHEKVVGLHLGDVSMNEIVFVQCSCKNSFSSTKAQQQGNT